MKKLALFVMIAVLSSGMAFAQSGGDNKDGSRFRPKYRNLSFATGKLSIDGVSTDALKKGRGGAFTTGRSYILHKNPVAGMLRFGIDATWFDMTYLNYQYRDIEINGKMHQGDIAVGIGGSVHVNPVSRLNVHVYFRYNPTFSALINTAGSAIGMAGYANVFTTGGAVSWGFISLGAEMRWGSGNYSKLFGEMEEDEGYLWDFSKKHKVKTTGGLRAYVSFRF